MKIYQVPEIEIEKFAIVDVVTSGNANEGGAGSPGDVEEL